MTVGELKRELDKYGDDYVVYIGVGTNANAVEPDVESVVPGLWGPEGESDPAVRGVALVAGDPADRG